MRIRITRVCSNDMDVQEAIRVSHSSVKSEIISLDAGFRIDGLPALQFLERVLETVSKKPAKGILSIINANESFLLIRKLILESLSQLTMFRQTFPTVLIQLNSTSSKTMRQRSK